MFGYYQVSALGGVDNNRIGIAYGRASNRNSNSRCSGAKAGSRAGGFPIAPLISDPVRIYLSANRKRNAGSSIATIAIGGSNGFADAVVRCVRKMNGAYKTFARCQ